MKEEPEVFAGHWITTEEFCDQIPQNMFHRQLDRSSLPEVIGDAGLLTDPDDIDGTVSCIRRLLGDEKLQKELIAKGYENVKRFDWDSRVEQYWEVLTK